ncbi:MAG: hypothetical protein MK078_03310 [Crocinitomicaceae bacterium]|nr:hypothetical protein [Crocinitomicaceae bacterium]
MKTKTIVLQILFCVFFPRMVFAQSAAVSEIATEGLRNNSIAITKMARLEFIKADRFTVLDEFDMEERLEGRGDEFYECYGKKCLISKGEALKVDYVLGGNVLNTGTKIVVSFKLIDVKNKSIQKTAMSEFDNNEDEIQRMLGIVISDLLGLEVDEVTRKRLAFKEEIITSNDVGKLNNSGPRFGVSYVGHGDLQDFFMRNEAEGGLGIQPVVSNIGYQFEGEYIGTENFGALAEVILNVAGMDQGQFIPSITLMNGFRFGKNGYEVAFGPSLGLIRTSTGLFDNNVYYSRTDWIRKNYIDWEMDPNNVDPVTGEVYSPFSTPSNDLYDEHLDKRGDFKFNASWVIAVGRTFQAGGLNMPVNLYYSSNKYGGIFGLNVGFNMTTSRTKINK